MEISEQNQPESKEILFEGELSPTLILFTRHADRISGRTEALKNQKEKWHEVLPEERNMGNITLKGAKETQDRTQARLEQIFKGQDPEKIDFLFLGSDTYFLGIGTEPEHQPLGQRALQTAEVELEETRKVMEGMGLKPEDHILNLQTRTTEKGEEKPLVKGNRFNQLGARPFAKNREANIYDNAPVLVFGELGAGLDFTGFMEKFENGEFDEELKGAGVETSKDLAGRANRGLQILALYARLRHRTHPDQKLVIFSDSHEDIMETFAKKKISGINPNFKLGHNDAISISLDEKSEHPTAFVGSKKYEIPSIDPNSRSE